MYTKYCGLYSNKPILLVALMWPFLPFIAYLLSTIKNATTTNIAHLLVLIPNLCIHSFVSLSLSRSLGPIQHSFGSFLSWSIDRQSVSRKSKHFENGENKNRKSKEPNDKRRLDKNMLHKNFKLIAKQKWTIKWLRGKHRASQRTKSSFQFIRGEGERKKESKIGWKSKINKWCKAVRESMGKTCNNIWCVRTTIGQSLYTASTKTLRWNTAPNKLFKCHAKHPKYVGFGISLWKCSDRWHTGISQNIWRTWNWICIGKVEHIR